VDIQERLFPFIHGKDEVLRRSLQMIEIAGYLELPILVTEQYVKGLGPTVKEVKDLLTDLGAYNPIEKRDFSCFGEVDFQDAFEASKLDTLAVVGIESHVCVMQTTLDGIDRGVDVFVAAEATGSRHPRHKQEALARMRDSGATLGSVEMFAFEVMRTSAHPAFKKVQKVIL
jgi:isochorismate hydrolase